MKKKMLIGAAVALSVPAIAIAQPGGERGMRADANGDGLIQMAEIEAQAEQRFARLDLDGNGAITQAEATEAREKMKAMMAERRAGGEGKRRGGRGGRGGDGAMFERADANGDGQLTFAEFSAPMMQRFAQHDANGDGAISAEERAAAREARKAARGSRSN